MDKTKYIRTESAKGSECRLNEWDNTDEIMEEE